MSSALDGGRGSGGYLPRTKSKVSSTQSSNSLTNLIGNDPSSSKPFGLRLCRGCFKSSSLERKRAYHQALVLFLTFIAYASFHMGRRPLSVVKNVLNRACGKPNSTTDLMVANLTFGQENTMIIPSNTIKTIGNSTCQDWAPFDDDATANHLLAYLDTAFLLSYAILMFFSGFVAERVNLRYFISIGSILSGVSLIIFGLAYPLNIHSMSYFLFAQVMSGTFQTTGWPVVVTCVSNWFDGSKQGLIYGIWNSHTSLGNILGATIAGFFVERDWGLSFMVPGGIMILVGVIMFLFLAPSPRDADLSPLNSHVSGSELAINQTVVCGDSGHRSAAFEPARLASTTSRTNSDFREHNPTPVSGRGRQEHAKAVSFMTALRIPGVIEFSLCLFFSKLVSYTFLYWLPRYISSSTTFNSEDSAYLSVPFDVGGIFGAILAGHLSDKLKVNGIICNLMLLMAIPMLFIYQTYGAISFMHNVLIQLLVGALVNGPYCLITTSVSADLGNRITDGKAMATVSAIIDGMGSVGAVLGPLFAGFVSSNDWQLVFYMLMAADVMASLCIFRVTLQDIRGTMLNRSSSRNLR